MTNIKESSSSNYKQRIRGKRKRDSYVIKQDGKHITIYLLRNPFLNAKLCRSILKFKDIPHEIPFSSPVFKDPKDALFIFIPGMNPQTNSFLDKQIKELLIVCKEKHWEFLYWIRTSVKPEEDYNKFKPWLEQVRMSRVRSTEIIISGHCFGAIFAKYFASQTPKSICITFDGEDPYYRIEKYKSILSSRGLLKSEEPLQLIHDYWNRRMEATPEEEWHAMQVGKECEDKIYRRYDFYFQEGIEGDEYTYHIRKTDDPCVYFLHYGEKPYHMLFTKQEAFRLMIEKIDQSRSLIPINTRGVAHYRSWSVNFYKHIAIYVIGEAHDRRDAGVTDW